MSMDFFTAFNVSASGLSAQRVRMNVISSNLANVDATDSADGGPYRRRDVVVSASPVERPFDRVLNDRIQQVQVTGVVEDPRPFRTVYDPYHPNADANGYVHYPNVNVMEEMVNMLAATRSYEANVSAVRAATEMAETALKIGQ